MPTAPMKVEVWLEDSSDPIVFRNVEEVFTHHFPDYWKRRQEVIREALDREWPPLVPHTEAPDDDA